MKTFICLDCDHTFSSSLQEDESECPNCFSPDVVVLEEDFEDGHYEGTFMHRSEADDE